MKGIRGLLIGALAAAAVILFPATAFAADSSQIDAGTIYATSGVSTSDPYYASSVRLSQGETLTFTDKTELKNFLTYYLCSYNLDSMNYTCENMNVLKRESNGTVTYEISLKPGTATNTEALVDAVVSYYGIEQYDDPKTTIEETFRRVHEKVHADTSALENSVMDTMQSGTAVCDQFEKIAHILLNAEGIPTVSRCGYYQNTCHAWTECLLNGQWQIVEFSYNGTDFSGSNLDFIFSSAADYTTQDASCLYSFLK